MWRFCALLVLSGLLCAAQRAPHIILIVADDMGWNDVSFHGSDQIPTPNIDALAYNGIILNSHYAQPMCSPSRAALMTGKYPMRIGMQRDPPLLPAETAGLPDGKLLPEYLKELGYKTHLVGKWHLGYAKWNQTPTYRGYDSHFGYYQGFTSYYDYVSEFKIGDKKYQGFDLWRNTQLAWDATGEYATDAFTNRAVELIRRHDDSKPLFLHVSHLAVHAGNDGKLLEAPQDSINKMKHIVDPNRRTYAAMVSRLDDGVGDIVSALDDRGMLSNAVIAFISDNGAPSIGTQFPNWGSNYPLRGQKATLFEGGVRTVACVWSPLMSQRPRVSNDLVHITDWLPTLYSAAGGDVGQLDIDVDGIDQWPSFVYDLPSPRNDIVLDINEVEKNAGLRFYNWKLIVGTSNNGTYNNYYGESGQRNVKTIYYNTSAVYFSSVGLSLQKSSYPSTTQSEYASLREQATLRCLASSAKKNWCDPTESASVCLYDIPSDPCEENDLSKYFPSVVRRMKRALVDYRSGLTPQFPLDVDVKRADPKHFNYTWYPFLEQCLDGACAI